MNKDATADVYKLGKVRDLCIATEDDESCALLFGNVYLSPSPKHTWKTEPKQFLRWATTTQLHQLNGAFVLLHIFQGSSQGYEARLATDKYGFKPLIYSQSDDILYFASHLFGLRYMLEGTWSGISYRSLLHFYHFGVTSSESTLLQGVKKVPPASELRVNSGTVSVQTYFDPLDLYEPKRYANAKEENICIQIDECMTRAVLRRKPARSLVGLALSGGVDSGYIARKLKEVNIPFKAYNLAYGDYYNEHDRIDRLAKDLDLDVTRIRVTAAQILESFEQANQLGSEPVGINDAALRILAQRARQDGIDTIWDGDGADRLFLGMNSHLKYFRVIKLYELLRKMRLVVPLLYGLKHVNHPEVKKLRVVLQNWSNGIPAYPERKYEVMEQYDYQYERKVFALGVERYWKAYTDRIGIVDFGLFFTYFSIKKCPEMFFHTPVEQQFYWGQRPVSPYWDDEIVSLALSIPTTMKINGGKTKYVLRKAAALNGDPDYWMLPKIGLQNALAYVKTTEEGRRWIEEQRSKIVATDEYRYLCTAAGEQTPDVDRLIPFILWKEAQLEKL